MVLKKGHQWAAGLACGLIVIALGTRTYLLSAHPDDVQLKGYRLTISDSRFVEIPDSVPLIAAAFRHGSVREANATDIKNFCGSCHALPPPSSLPKKVWRTNVLRGYEFLKMPQPQPNGK